MPFDFNQFLILAEELASKGDVASKRSSISRAYYTAYHLALARAETNVGEWRNRIDKKLSAHVWCWKQYSDTSNVYCQQIGIDGDRMKRRRHLADYQKNDIANLDAEVQRQIEDVRQFQIDLAALDLRYPRP